MKSPALFLGLLLIAGALLAGCTQYQAPPATPAPTTTAPPATTAPPTPTPTPRTDTIRVVSNPQYGQILADANGRTLYYFLKDTRGAMASACTGACIALWPAFHTDTVQVSGPILASNFGEFTRADGTRQTSFMGWPLYYYAPDTAPGDAKGQGFNSLWYVIGPTGIVTTAPTTTMPTTVPTTTMPTTVPTTYYYGGY